LTCLSKAGQPDYKPADRFINRWPVYKPVRFTISSQHIQFAHNDAQLAQLAKGVEELEEQGV